MGCGRGGEIAVPLGVARDGVELVVTAARDRAEERRRFGGFARGEDRAEAVATGEGRVARREGALSAGRRRDARDDDDDARRYPEQTCAPMTNHWKSRFRNISALTVRIAVA